MYRYIILIKLENIKIVMSKINVLHENISEDKEESLQLIVDYLPDNLKFAMEPLSRELENLCAEVNNKITLFFNKPENNLEYGLLVVKVMEIIDNIKTISSITGYSITGYDKYIVAVRCIIEIIKETKYIPTDIKNDLILTIPGSIEAVIQLTKGESLNRNIKGINIIESSYITKRAFERIIEFIKSKNYHLSGLLENVFMIVTQLMYIVGSYPSLTGPQKKTIVVDVIRNIITKYRDTETSKKISSTFVNMVLDLVPSIIDVLVSVSEGLFDINTVKKCCSFCIPCC
jgi:hypothetical protein